MSEHDPLRVLLERADRAAPAMRPSDDLADRARTIVRRRSTRRRAIAATACVIGGTVALILSQPNPTETPTPIAPSIAQTNDLPALSRSQIARIKHTLTLDRAERAARLELASLPPDPLDALDARIDRIAAGMMFEAERWSRSPATHDRAIERCESVVDLAPDSSHAAAAQQLIQQLSPGSNSLKPSPHHTGVQPCTD